MQFFWFQREAKFNFQELSTKVENAQFDGILFPYSSYDEDYFISIAKNINKNSTIKYMVAIRPYTISPQYIFKIIKAINKISKNKILINFVSGWVYDDEKYFGGIHGDINDMSSNIDKSNYLIDYLKTVNKMNSSLLNFYVSITNDIMFEKIKNNKIIVPYLFYKEKNIDLNNSKTMIAIAPIIRKTKKEINKLKDYPLEKDSTFFTEKEFFIFLDELKSKNINGLLIFEHYENSENENIFKLIKQYNNFLKEKK